MDQAIDTFLNNFERQRNAGEASSSSRHISNFELKVVQAAKLFEKGVSDIPQLAFTYV